MVTQSTTAAAGGEFAGDEVTRMVLSICHATGSWVSAIRMNAQLLDHELSPVELAKAALDVEDLSARVGALLGLVRPLIAEEAAATGTFPANVMLGVREALDAHGGRGVTLSVVCDEGLPEIAGQPETLHQLIFSLVHYALDGARPGNSVVVRTESGPAGESVAFVIEDTGPEDRELQSWRSAPLRGRTLACALGSCILGRLGGQIDGDSPPVSKPHIRAGRAHDSHCNARPQRKFRSLRVATGNEPGEEDEG